MIGAGGLRGRFGAAAGGFGFDPCLLSSVLELVVPVSVSLHLLASLTTPLLASPAPYPIQANHPPHHSYHQSKASSMHD